MTTLILVRHKESDANNIWLKDIGMALGLMKEISWASNASVAVVRRETDRWYLVQEGFELHLAGLKTQFPANV